MKEYKYTINGNEYKVTIGEIEGNIANVEVNGKTYKVEMEQKAEEDPEGLFHRRQPLDSCCGLSCGSWLGSTPLEEDSHESSVIRNPWTDGKG